MKKIALSLIAVGALMFNGCSSNSLTTSTIGATKEVKTFLKGKVIKTEKVLVSKSMNAVLTGAGVGAVTGGVIGGAAGLISSQFGEEESYKTTIKTSNGKKYIAYLEKQLIQNSRLEFIARDSGKVTNVNLLSDVNDDKLTDAIDSRYFKNGVWNYHLTKYDLVVTSKKKYYYLNDLVNVTFDKNYEIKKITKLKSGFLSQAKIGSKPIKLEEKKEVAFSVWGADSKVKETKKMVVKNDVNITKKNQKLNKVIEIEEKKEIAENIKKADLEEQNQKSFW